MEDLLALSGESVWKKDVASAASKEYEVEIYLTSGESFRGFLTGLDTMWLQLTTSRLQDRVLTSIQNIQSMRFTGETINSLGFTESVKRKIRGFSYSFKKTAEEYLEAKSEG